MTIEIADRLVKLRKKYGYSQEELADKLGLSRQAVSKWERAEASPDTDNLICLAKLYGVSLDELLATDEDIDTIVEEQVKDEDKKQEEQEQKKDDRVVINDKGIYVHGKDGGSVVIDDNGITCTNKDGKVVKKCQEPDKAMVIIGCFEGVLFLLATLAYFLVSSLLGYWGTAWIVFLLPEIICSIARAIRKKNANQFNMPFLAAFAFFFVCMFMRDVNPEFPKLWHPMWVVFFSIPIYYTTVSAINKAIGKEEWRDHYDNDKDDDDDDDDKDEDDD